MFLLLFRLCLSEWKDFFSGEPNTTLSGYLIPDNVYEGDVYLQNAKAINFLDHVIYMKTDDYVDLLVENTFFMNIQKDYAGGAIYWRTPGNVSIVNTCVYKVTTDARFPGAFFYYQGTGDINISYISIVFSGTQEKNALNALAFKPNISDVKYLNHSTSYSATGGYASTVQTTFSYSNIQDNFLSTISSHYSLILCNTSNFHHLNFVNNTFTRIPSAAIIFESRKTSILTYSYFVTTNSTYLAQKQYSDNLFQMLVIYTDRQYKSLSASAMYNTSELMKIVLLNTYQCEAEYTPAEPTKNRMVVIAASAATGAVVGTASLAGLGIWIFKKASTKAVTAAVKSAMNDSDEEYTYETYEVQSEKEEEEKESDKDKEKQKETDETNEQQEKEGSLSSDRGDISISQETK